MILKRALKYKFKSFLREHIFNYEINRDLVYFIQTNHRKFEELILENSTSLEFIYSTLNRKIYMKLIFNKKTKMYDVYICGYFIPFIIFPNFNITYDEVIISLNENELKEKFVFID